MIRYAVKADKDYWLTLDTHINEYEFLLKARDRRGYIICDGDIPIGVTASLFLLSSTSPKPGKERALAERPCCFGKRKCASLDTK